MSGIKHKHLPLDWDERTINVFREVYQLDFTDPKIQLMVHKTLLGTASCEQRIKLLELACCFNLEPLAKWIIEQYGKTGLHMRPEILVRIAFWISHHGAKDYKSIKQLLTLLSSFGVPHFAEPESGDWAECLATLCESPDAFELFVKWMPIFEDALTVADVADVISVAWNSTITSAVASSWIDDRFPGLWAKKLVTRLSEFSGKPDAAQLARAIASARHAIALRYGERHETKTQCLNYATMPMTKAPNEPFDAADETLTKGQAMLLIRLNMLLATGD